MVANKLEYDSLEYLIEVKGNDNPEFSDIKRDKVGINNDINAMRLLSDNEFLDSAYVEYKDGVYEAVYWKSYPKTATSNYNAAVCIGFNDIASNYLEKQFIKLFDN